MSKRVLFIEKNDRYPVGNAKDFGEVVYLFERAPLSFNVDSIADAFEAKLQEIKFNPEEDHFALTGHITMLAVMSATIFAAYDRVPFLIFDAKNGKYASSTLHDVTEDSDVPTNS